MKNLTILFKNRPEGRRFLKICKKHPLFKQHFVRWDSNKIFFNFNDEEQGGIVSDIIVEVLKEIEADFEVI